MASRSRSVYPWIANGVAVAAITAGALMLDDEGVLRWLVFAAVFLPFIYILRWVSDHRARLAWLISARGLLLWLGGAIAAGALIGMAAMWDSRVLALCAFFVTLTVATVPWALARDRLYKRVFDDKDELGRRSQYAEEEHQLETGPR